VGAALLRYEAAMNARTLWLAVLLLLPSVASARESAILAPGLLFSASKRPDGFAPALGVEVSLYKFTGELRTVGGFAQWQTVEFDHHRFCAGAQGSYKFFGMELGATHETEGEHGAPTTSLHFAPYFTVLYATASLRVGIPLLGGREDKPGHGYDVGLVLTIKMPIEIEDHSAIR
jgi:hypothetical protein